MQPLPIKKEFTGLIKLNEKHHASIVLGFYKALAEKGKQGLDVFVRAAQFYGEERGRRMALRALRDGHPLDYVSYFAYGEWESTPGFYDVTMTPRPGVVDEQICRCPWADVFRAADFTACGTAYCREIDRAIVCGFTRPCSWRPHRPNTTRIAANFTFAQTI